MTDDAYAYEDDYLYVNVFVDVVVLVIRARSSSAAQGPVDDVFLVMILGAGEAPKDRRHFCDPCINFKPNVLGASAGDHQNPSSLSKSPYLFQKAINSCEFDSLPLDDDLEKCNPKIVPCWGVAGGAVELART